ncbi:hypothetical protein MAM1_0014d01389 [Mucor ambiguus]|uniref:F-box domain-containing protein n=1 Tax=Mucor ambiguus TaxID=91626 RepID=A0A0C9MFQ8_9FUNG|nr:hypothetical protein MAM1_0014d01389 [Mucor ambiguus]
MTTINSLPDELLSCIFDYIASITQLTACRLVCRKWNFPAETAMFSKKIKITSEEQAIVLYGCLFRDPSKGRLIKHLDFSIRVHELPVIYYYLLDLAFTPYIEQLTGFVEAEDFFTALGDIANDSIEEFSKLRTLPKGPNQNIVLQALICLNVRSLTIGSDFLMSNAPMLGRFLSLTELEILGYKKNWQDLDTILKCCPDIIILKFVGLKHGPTVKSIADVSTWLAARVTKQMNLEKLEFKNSTVSAEVAEYIRYKYPNIRTTMCDGYNEAGYRYNTFYSLHRVLNAMRDLYIEQATLILSSESTLMWSLEFAQSRKEYIRFQIDKNENLIMKVKFEQKKL